jgi:predicted kinase
VLARALAPDLAPAPGAVVLRSDVERKQQFGVGETQRLPAQAYWPEVSVAIYTALGEKARRVIAAGHSAVVDAVFAGESERAAMDAVAAELGVAYRPLFLVADVETRARRAGARGPDASDADAEVSRQQEAYALGGMGWATVDASGTPEETVARALLVLNRRIE